MPDHHLKKSFTFKTNRNVAIKNIKDKHVVTLISLGKGINGERKVASEEELHVELLKQLNKFPPKKNIILVAGLLKRWNYWEMVKEVSDETLKERLKDIPENIDEKDLAAFLAKKFIDIATSLEAKYIQSIKDHFKTNEKILKDISFPYHLTCWDQRTKFDNYDEKSYDQSHFVSDSKSLQRIETTISNFLKNKKNELAIAKTRMIKAQPKLDRPNLDFVELANQACLAYILEEYEYFAKLKSTEIFYNGEMPPALEPIFKENQKDLYWRTYLFKQIKNNVREEKSIVLSLRKTKSDSFIDDIKDHQQETKSGEKHFKLFSLLQTTDKSPKETIESKQPKQFIDVSRLTPRSKSMLTFFELLSRKPESKEKEEAMQKIAEAKAILNLG